jgi:hypothetical protein
MAPLHELAVQALYKAGIKASDRFAFNPHITVVVVKSSAIELVGNPPILRYAFSHP